jgi:hypothetical protein
VKSRKTGFANNAVMMPSEKMMPELRTLDPLIYTEPYRKRKRASN